MTQGGGDILPMCIACARACDTGWGVIYLPCALCVYRLVIRGGQDIPPVCTACVRACDMGWGGIYLPCVLCVHEPVALGKGGVIYLLCALRVHMWEGGSRANPHAHPIGMCVAHTTHRFSVFMCMCHVSPWHVPPPLDHPPFPHVIGVLTHPVMAAPPSSNSGPNGLGLCKCRRGEPMNS